MINPLNAELNPIRHLLALAGARHFVNVSRIRVNDVHIALVKVTERAIAGIKLCSPNQCGLTWLLWRQK
jgi:uncharacterized Fe-S cluster-containing protein